MTSYLDWAMMRPRETTLDRFYEQDTNWLPTDGGRGPVRLHGGHGSFFDFKTRTDNAADTLDSWVHSGDEGNNIFSSVAGATITAGITSGDTTIPLSAVTEFADGEHIKIDSEMILIGTISGSSATGCTRGQLGTTAAAHSSGASVYPQLDDYGTRIWYAQGQSALFWDTDQGFASSFAGISTDGAGGGQTLFGRLSSANPTVNMWAGYDEGIRGAGTLGQGSVWGRETATMNFAGDHASGSSRRGGRPYLQGWNGQTINHLLQTGGGNTNAYNADNPLVVGAAGADFWRGMVFENGSITNPDGDRAEAILLPEDYTITWYSPDDERALDIFSTISDGIYAQEFLFGDDGLTYRLRDTGGGLFRVNYVDNAVNYFELTPSVTGSPIRMDADGTDTNVSIDIYAKGTGTIGFHSDVDALAMGAPIYMKNYTVATLPSVLAKGVIYVSDETGGPTLAFSDGTNWRRVQDRAIVS